ncbi:MAG: alpha-amylase family glycosyl hydrolase, partial [Planctomycetota bacterium]
MPPSQTHSGRKNRHLNTARRRLTLEILESRQLMAAESAPAILQWFDGSFDTIEDRTVDIFETGYGAVWLPPPGRADSGNQSVGYDVYDRFELGSPDRPTLYGTETGLKQLGEQFEAAAIDLHIDAILNHAGFSDQGTPGFVDAGGYPGLAITLDNAIDGDFHSGFDTGVLQGRLS